MDCTRVAIEAVEMKRERWQEGGGGTVDVYGDVASCVRMRFGYMDSFTLQG